MSTQVHEQPRGQVPKSAALRVELFGPTRARTSHGVVGAGEFGGVKPRQILEILATSAGRPVSKERLAELLWNGHPPKCYVATLESYVSVLRRSMGVGGTRSSGIDTVMHGYLLDPTVVVVDLGVFRSLVRAARAGNDGVAASLANVQQALELVTGDLLATEPYASWAISEREQFERELVAAACLGATMALSVGRPDVAMQMAGLAIEYDSLAEGAWRSLMQAQCALGRRSEALRSYADLRQCLAEELGTDPSRETTELYVDMLRHHAARGVVGHVNVHDEVRMLVRALRQVLGTVPGVELNHEDHALVAAAAELTVA